MSATKFCITIATAALLTATAAQAHDIAAPAPVSTPTAAPVAIDRGLSQRYCIVGEITASRILRRDCASLAEWQVLGVDPRRMPRR